MGMEIALLIAPCYWLWNAIVMGFITKYENMPVYYAWTYWISYLQYGFYGAMLNQFQGEEWNMCSSLNSGSFSLQTIIDALTTGEITQVATNLLNEVQTTVQDATAFDFPFQLSDAYCAAANQTTDKNSQCNQCRKPCPKKIRTTIDSFVSYH